MKRMAQDQNVARFKVALTDGINMQGMYIQILIDEFQ